ncbi:hypothetical protein CEUSTIGMA_g12608.t1 [Chlamydomonas eustigma]|uniref:Uncharacterized protein n=1 Tax=Chlamydomonas eustigma TaxID=1157962 RepID=A0A250XQW3_9CHLO|nr:hypothetical protein CEUSTIGMA_g12608.t1 [Chlamydomonas eustigma]|eukprot:GAX85190.1 hypothetical protein CEUSTIGMA_g12608.t1 [Chlamydomonas eustigma]
MPSGPHALPANTTLTQPPELLMLPQSTLLNNCFHSFWNVEVIYQASTPPHPHLGGRWTAGRALGHTLIWVEGGLLEGHWATPSSGWKSNPEGISGYSSSVEGGYSLPNTPSASTEVGHNLVALGTACKLRLMIKLLDLHLELQSKSHGDSNSIGHQEGDILSSFDLMNITVTSTQLRRYGSPRIQQHFEIHLFPTLLRCLKLKAFDEPNNCQPYIPSAKLTSKLDARSPPSFLSTSLPKRMYIWACCLMLGDMLNVVPYSSTAVKPSSSTGFTSYDDKESPRVFSRAPKSEPTMASESVTAFTSPATLPLLVRLGTHVDWVCIQATIELLDILQHCRWTLPYSVEQTTAPHPSLGVEQTTTPHPSLGIGHPSTLRYHPSLLALK